MSETKSFLDTLFAFLNLFSLLDKTNPFRFLPFNVKLTDTLKQIYLIDLGRNNQTTFHSNLDKEHTQEEALQVDLLNFRDSSKEVSVLNNIHTKEILFPLELEVNYISSKVLSSYFINSQVIHQPIVLLMVF